MNDSDFVVSPQAYADLDSIYDYIAADNPGAAALLLNRFDRAFRLLAAFPRIGASLRVEEPERRLMFPVRGYRIIYRPSDHRTGIEILRVYHGARDLSNL